MPFLQDCSEGLLPGVCAGAEAMGRPKDTVIALSMVNISHVTARLLNSLLLLLRKHKARGSGVLSKQTSQRQAVCVHLSVLTQWLYHNLAAIPNTVMHCSSSDDREGMPVKLWPVHTSIIYECIWWADKSKYVLSVMCIFTLLVAESYLTALTNSALLLGQQVNSDKSSSCRKASLCLNEMLSDIMSVRSNLQWNIKSEDESLFVQQSASRIRGRPHEINE